jgi:FtsP/CotA-like multicopper oxidase with cupredoxin domain
VRKYFAFLVISSLVAACGGEESRTDVKQINFDAGVDAEDAGADVDHGPEPVFSSVWGAPNLEDENPAANIVEVSLRAEETRVTLSDGLEVDMYTYNGSLPGPIIQAQVGQTVIIHFQNDLPEPTTVHWHGLRIPDKMDGTPRVQDPVEPGETFTYEFVVPDAGSYWYHPHVRSNEQVEKGLYGLFVVRDEQEPEFDQERYFTIDDILLDQNGEMPDFLTRHPEIMHGRTGNTLLTNGSADVVSLSADQNAVERWRLVNPANARTMTLELVGASWRVIGTDGGYLPQPYETERLVLPVGQRFDVEVIYDEATVVELNSIVLVRNEQGEFVEDAFELVTVDVSAVDREPRQVELPDVALPDRQPTRDETIVFDVRQALRGTEWTLNGEANAQEPLFTFANREVVRIKLRNDAGPEHPFHLHGNFFTIVDDGREWTDQPGLKDTVLVPGMDEVEIIAYLDNPGQWMAHCHILEHAELGMMSEIIVEAPQQ